MITGLQTTMMAQLKNAKHIGDIDMAKHKGKVRFSAPLEPKKGGGFKKQSRIRVKKTGNGKEEIFYTGGERGGPKGFGKKGKVTTKVSPAGRKTQTVKGKSLQKRLKTNLGDVITGTGKDKAKKLKRQHMFSTLGPGSKKPKLKRGGRAK